MQNPGPVWKSRMPWPLNKPPISSQFFYQGKYTNPGIIQAELNAHSISLSCSSAPPEASLLKIAFDVVKTKSGKGPAVLPKMQRWLQGEAIKVSASESVHPGPLDDALRPTGEPQLGLHFCHSVTL